MIQTKSLTGLSALKNERPLAAQFSLKMANDDNEEWTGPTGQLYAGGINVAGEAPFEIRGFSLGNALLGTGLAVTVASFTEFFLTAGSEGLSGLGFVYGIPISLIGCALKYAELEPVPVSTTPEAEKLFEEKATATLKQIKNDVTRHRYGDEAHLETSVKALGLVMPMSDYPQLIGIKETITEDGELAFGMLFQSKETPYKIWAAPEKIPKYETFFGPGVKAEISKVNSAERILQLTLTTYDPSKEVEEKSEEAATEAVEAKADS
eukprot:CAMPEP_0117752212 /NCGR_PEP_ID=MMETSP0947-20121206/11472_1 /TAXON_ID=44440 /ORGANISM="Chattonella subsalsa, Strain CCMP2191" /LENGTH=264 /DNA_ID=CAMNT_0005570813 /DNA_START=293 /DNA_END=1087 /DNA_ORIENTATION=+